MLDNRRCVIERVWQCRPYFPPYNTPYGYEEARLVLLLCYLWRSATCVEKWNSPDSMSVRNTPSVLSLSLSLYDLVSLFLSIFISHHGNRPNKPKRTYWLHMQPDISVCPSIQVSSKGIEAGYWHQRQLQRYTASWDFSFVASCY